MSERHLTRKHRPLDSEYSGEGASLSTFDQAHDGELTDLAMSSRHGLGGLPTSEFLSVLPSASSAGHSLANIPIMPQAERVAGPAGSSVSPDAPLQAKRVASAGL
jgi:hypothetical protein